MRAGPSADSLPAAINDIERDLHATTNEIALSLSLFILVQGNFPLIWFAISEIKGRKFVYIFSMIVRSSFVQQTPDLNTFQIFTIGSAVGGASMSIGVLICMRMFQGAGSSAVLAIGAGTLAVSEVSLIRRTALTMPSRIYILLRNEGP